MIDAIRGLDARTARGILARMALSFEEEFNPSAQPEVDNELELRKQIQREIEEKLQPGLDEEHRRLEILDVLDREIDELSDAPEADLIIKLAMKGEAPTDLYHVQIIDNIRDYCGKNFEIEEANIRDCVANGDFAQHFGPNPSEPALKLISLFGKHFVSSVPDRSFLLLVAGRNDGLILDVHQAWRIYPDIVQFSPRDDLLTILRKFADVFGAEFEFEGKRGKFLTNVISTANGPITQNLEILPLYGRNSRGVKVPKEFRYMLSYFSQNIDSEHRSVSLIVAINLLKYLSLVERRGWKIAT